jgi:O-antigen/teichoic acid export membrane protein
MSSAESGVTSRRIEQTLASSVVLLLAFTVLQRGLGFVRSLLFCQYLEPEQLGLWDLGFGFLCLAAPLVGLGLPGSFGRYVERFRQRGQLGQYLSRITIAVVALTAAGAALLLACPAAASWTVFGISDRRDLVQVTTITLAAVIAYNSLVELLTGLRAYRAVSLLNFANSALFVLASGAAFVRGRADAIGVISAYGMACGVSATGAIIWLHWNRREFAVSIPASSERVEWSPVLAFSLWLWMTNLLANLFDVVDRWMVLHLHPDGAEAALRELGQYHSARIFPLLLISLAAAVGSMLTAHLSRDWEAGRRDLVGRRINLGLKLVGCALIAIGTALLVLTPTLFRTLYPGKFGEGMELLPLTLLASVWFALSNIAVAYLWCVERAHRATLAFGIGIVVNLALNMWWLPMWGLWGAVAATSIAQGTALACLLRAGHRHGLRLSRWTLVIALVPLALYGGAIAALTATVLLAIAVWRGGVFDRWERAQLVGVLRRRAG